VLGEPGHLHGATRPGDIGIRRNLIGGRCDLVEGGRPVKQRVPQICVAEGAQWALTFFEAARADGFTFQVSTPHAGKFFRVSALMNDDVPHRPGFTSRAGIGSTLLRRIHERLPLGKSVVVDLSNHNLAVPTCGEEEA